ncbi:AT-rich interactive domain-containing protein 4B-like [Centruroides sculpturatus]|uniref:AT-rich interactive domain-containing protein 4B-like n=1 Tax=Centruroides sculpturatus TaxID=218467 RepID=UPI000C6E902B|nr:AT-rich interactive domain-containing protein 4B-like [Centruroides sculpturatus]
MITKIKSKQKSDESVERRSRPSKSDDGESTRQKEESKSPNNPEPKREKIETRGSLKNEQEKIKCNLIKDKKKEKSVNGKTKEEKNNKEKPKVTTKEVAKDKSVPVKVKVEEDKEQLKKKNGKSEDKDSGEKVATNDSEMKPKRNEAIVRIGDRIRVKYGNGKQHKKYEAKVLKIERESGERKFFVHYTGWNVRYDEWIKKNKIVEVIENKSGNDRKKKGVLWPGSKSKELVKRSKLFKLSLRKSKASSLATSKISKSASVICRTRRQDSASDSSSNGGSQTRKSRRKPPDSDNEADTSHNTNDTELGQESQSRSDPNTSDETIKVEFSYDAEESSEEKNFEETEKEETEKEEEHPWEDGDTPDDKELPKLEEETAEDTKIGVFANLSPVLPPEEGPNSAEHRTGDSVDLPDPGFDITSNGFIPCQNIKVEKDWELESPEECEKIPEAALSSKDSEGLEMPDISTDQNAIGPKLEMAAAKTEEEKTETELEETLEPVNSDDLHPPEIAWKMESLPDSASSFNDDHPPPLEKKPDFSPDAGEERYETRPLLERAVSETEELSCKIPNITLRDYLGGENSADEEGSVGKSSSECNSRSEHANGDGLEAEDNPRRSCHHKTEERTRPRGEAATAKKDKKKKKKLFKAEGGDVNADLSGKSDAENRDRKEGEPKKKAKKEKKKKDKRPGESSREAEKESSEGSGFCKKEQKREEEQATSAFVRPGGKNEEFKKTKKNKKKNEASERKAKRKKKKKEAGSLEEGNSSDSDKSSKARKCKKDRKKSKKKRRASASESDPPENDGVESADKKSEDSEDSASDSGRSDPFPPRLEAVLGLSSSPCSETEPSDASLDPASESSVDFSANASSAGPEGPGEAVRVVEASTVLDNTPPTTPDSAPSYLSNSPAYDGDVPPKDDLAEDADGTEATESEDSLSRTESAILFLANRAASGKNDSRAKSANALKRQSAEIEEARLSKKKRTSKGFSSGGKRNHPKNAKGEQKEYASDNTSGSHRCGLPASASNSASGTRTSKFNFYVPLDAYTDPDKRIAILQESLSELKKTYMALKAEVALIDRHRKKAKKKEKEGAAAAISRPGIPAENEAADS